MAFAMGQIAVAGISGYTGQRVLPHLGPDAKLLLRPSTAKKWTDPRVVSVDLLDEQALEAALAGVETIVCLVGTTKAQFAPARDGEHAVNYDTVDIGIPRALANAGKRAGCKRFVLLSSYGIESSPGAYPSAKREAEAAVKASGLDWVILRPSFIVGPGRAAARTLDVVWAPVKLFARGFADNIRSIDVETLAHAVVATAKSAEWDGRVLEGKDLHGIAK
jgi:uncharacterized protein YbjT (DUF2867 family)